MQDQDQRAVLAVDVDGVISLFGFDDSSEPPGEFRLIDGVPHCISRPVGDRLRRLSEWYELVWATGWEQRANDHLPTLLGLPGELPYLTFAGEARFGTAHWKIAAIDEYARDRPVAWVDDCIDDSCRMWAKERERPTLLVPVDSSRGLEEDQTEALIAWAQRGYTP